MPQYSLEYVISGQRPQAIEYWSEVPVQAGQVIHVAGMQLRVERIVRFRPKVNSPERAICKRV